MGEEMTPNMSPVAVMGWNGSPKTMWVVFQFYSGGGARPKLITAISDEATAMAVKATHEASYDIYVEEVPVWPVTRKME